LLQSGRGSASTVAHVLSLTLRSVQLIISTLLAIALCITGQCIALFGRYLMAGLGASYGHLELIVALGLAGILRGVCQLLVVILSVRLSYVLLRVRHVFAGIRLSVRHVALGIGPSISDVMLNFGWRLGFVAASQRQASDRYQTKYVEFHMAILD
jgi:hypothetical protein